MKVFKLEKVIAHMKNGVNVKQNKNGVGDKLSRIETISDGDFNFDKVGFAELSSDQKSKYKINKNDILFSHINSLEHLGKTAIYEANQEIYHGVNLLLIRANDLVLPRYLRYFFIFLRNSGYWIKNGKQAINQASVNQADIKNIQIPVPSLQEQEKIVEKLDKLFENIDNYKLEIDKTINNSRKLFISILDKVYSPLSQEDLQLKKLSDISEIKGGKRVPKGYKLLDKKTNFPYIRVSDFDSNGGIDESNLKFIDENIYNQIQKYTINSNDLFISIAGTIGKSGMIPSKLNGANLTENACKLVFNESAHNRFIYFFTKSNFFNKQVLEKTKTAGQPKLAISRLGEILVQIPTLEKQIELTKKFDEIEAKINSLINNKNNLIYKTKLLKKSILNKEFSYE
jgi:type I restriction enzyme S subunit